MRFCRRLEAYPTGTLPLLSSAQPEPNFYQKYRHWRDRQASKNSKGESFEALGG